MWRIIREAVLLERVRLVPPQLLRSQLLSTSASSPQPTASNVPGLSENIVKVPSSPVGPGASKEKEYKNPEYFCYHMESFGEAEVELAKYRLPAPSNKRPFQR